MQHPVRLQHKFLFSAVAASLAVTLPAVAQERPRLEEIVVTASARKQSVQDIPYNISAMDGGEIAAQQITDQAELLRSISGVSVMDRGYRNSGMVNSIIIRGLNVDSGLTGDIALNAVPTVSTYVDNTPLFANFVLKDIARVEVLRGPRAPCMARVHWAVPCATFPTSRTRRPSRARWMWITARPRVPTATTPTSSA